MKYNNMKHLFRMLGICALSVAIVGCGSTGGKTKKTSTAAVQDAQLADIEKTSLKTYKTGEKTKDGMRVQNSDGTYTYGAANVSSKFRKDEETTIGYNDELKMYTIAYSLEDDNNNNSIIFSKTEDGDLVGINFNVTMNDDILAKYKEAGVLPTNATKKTAKKMVEKEIAYIKNTLKRKVSSDDLDLSDKPTKIAYEYEKRGYYMDLSDKENYQYKGSKRPKADSYINNVVETYMIDLGDGNFSAGVNFNIGSTQWNAGNKGIQILSQRYGFDKLHRDNNTYNSEINKDTTSGIIKALLTNVYKYSNSDWIKHDEIKFNSGNDNDTYEVKDELSKLAQSNN